MTETSNIRRQTSFVLINQISRIQKINPQSKINQHNIREHRENVQKQLSDLEA